MLALRTTYIVTRFDGLGLVFFGYNTALIAQL